MKKILSIILMCFTLVPAFGRSGEPIIRVGSQVDPSLKAQVDPLLQKFLAHIAAGELLAAEEMLFPSNDDDFYAQFRHVLQTMHPAMKSAPIKTLHCFQVTNSGPQQGVLFKTPNQNVDESDYFVNARKGESIFYILRIGDQSAENYACIGFNRVKGKWGATSCLFGAVSISGHTALSFIRMAREAIQQEQYINAYIYAEAAKVLCHKVYGNRIHRMYDEIMGNYDITKSDLRSNLQFPIKSSIYPDFPDVLHVSLVGDTSGIVAGVVYESKVNNRTEAAYKKEWEGLSANIERLMPGIKAGKFALNYYAVHLPITGDRHAYFVADTLRIGK